MPTRKTILRLLAFSLILWWRLSAAAQITLVNVLGACDFSAGAPDGSETRSHCTCLTFTATGGGFSSYDGSSARGAQMSAYGGGLFNGAERFEVEAGSFADTNSLLSGGETSIYFQFQLTNLFRCRIESSVLTRGNIDGGIEFVGPAGTVFENNRGTMSFDTTLVAPGLYHFNAELTDGDTDESGSGSLSYAMSLTPEDIPPGRLDAATKSACYAQYSALEQMSHLLIKMADSSSMPGMRKALLESANFVESEAQVSLEDAMDPVDTNYMTLAVAAALPVIALGAGSGVTPNEAAAFNAWMTNLSQRAGFSAAVVTSLNRAEGAAIAGNSSWDTAQLNAAVQFEAQYAGLVDQDPTIRSNLEAQFVAGSFPTITVTTNEAAAFEDEVITNGFPTDLVDALTNLGVSSEGITNLETDLVTSDPDTMVGSFPQSLIDTNYDLSARQLAAAFRNNSLILINAAVLPTGQFRFDIPTEYGYTYAIQSNSDLSIPAGWTTVFSTNASAALLSFTNTAAPNTFPAFYRAYVQ